MDEENTTLYELMEISRIYALIADERDRCFERSANSGEPNITLMGRTSKFGPQKLGVNDVVVYALLKILID